MKYENTSILPEKKGDNGMLLTHVPKVFNNVFLFAGLTTFGTLANYDWLSV